MTKPIQDQDTQDIDELESLEFVASEDDYGFVFGPDGELKHVFTPNKFELDPPAVIKKILKLLGIDDINQLDFDGDGTLH